MKKNTTLMSAALITGATALITAGLAAPAVFADEPSQPAPTPTGVAETAQPVQPTAEQLAAAGLIVDGLTITPGTDSYTVTADSISLANGATDAVFSIGDNRFHNGGVNYTDWFDVTAANNGAGYTATIPITGGDYTVTLSAAYTTSDGTPLLGNLAQAPITIAGNE